MSLKHNVKCYKQDAAPVTKLHTYKHGQIITSAFGPTDIIF